MDRTIPTYLKNKFVLLLIGVVVLTAGILGFTYWNAANNVQPDANRIVNEPRQFNRSNSVSRWAANRYPGDPILPHYQDKNADYLTLGFQPGQTYYVGVRLCYSFTVPAAHAIGEISFIYVTNEYGRNGVSFWVNGAQQSPQVTNLGAVTDPLSSNPMTQKKVVINAGTVGAGGSIEICNQVIDSSTARNHPTDGRRIQSFPTASYIRVTSYALGGYEAVNTPDPVKTTTITGQVRDWNNKNLPNITIDTCIAGVSPKTNSQGIYEFSVLQSTSFCLRVNQAGLPAGTTGVKANAGQTAGSFAAAGQSSYEFQVAGVACRNGGCAAVQGSNDRDIDTGYTFSLLGATPASPVQSACTAYTVNAPAGATRIEAQDVGTTNRSASNATSGPIHVVASGIGNATGCNAVRMVTNAGFVKYTFKAPTTGKYAVLIRGKGPLSITSPSRAAITLNRNFGTDFSNQNVTSIVAGENSGLINVTNTQSTITIEVKRNAAEAYVDFLELRKEAEMDTPSAPGSGASGAPTPKCANGSGSSATVVNAEAGVCNNNAAPFTSPADQVGSGTSVILPNTNS